MKLTVELTKDKGIRMKSGPNVLLCEQLLEAVGRSATMTPVDLLMASLGSSVATSAAKFCAAHGIPMEGFTLTLEWDEGTEAKPLSKVVAFVHMPNALAHEMEDDFMSAIHDCVIYRILNDRPEIHFHPTTMVEKPEGAAVVHFGAD